jgi:cytochrome c553
MRGRPLSFLGAVVLMSSSVISAMPAQAQEYLQAVEAAPDLDRGAQYFVTCASCHGTQGGGRVDGRVPRIGGQHFRVIVKQLVAFRHGGRWDMTMEYSADRHQLADAQAIADVAGYVSQLDDPMPPGVGTGEWLRQGTSLYFQHCEGCHGSSGQGNPDQAVPKIGGQHYEYLRRQIYGAIDGRRPAFPPDHVRLLARLDHDGIAGIADYLSRITPRHAQSPVIPAVGRPSSRVTP